MNSVWSKKIRSLSGLLHFFTQLAWYLCLIWLIIYSIFFILEAAGISSARLFYLQAHFELDSTEQIFNLEAQHLAVFDNPTLSISISNLDAAAIRSWIYFSAFLIKIGFYIGLLYVLTLLKRILRSLWLKREDSWSTANVWYLRRIGYLMLAAVPYQYAIGWLSYLATQQLQLSDKLTLLWPSIYWEIVLAGLAFILVAYIFEEGSRLHKEQQLTV